MKNPLRILLPTLLPLSLIGLAFSCITSVNSGVTPPVVATAPKPVTNPKTVGPSQKPSALVITPSFEKLTAVNENIICFNTGFMFSSPMEREPEVAVITKTLRPKVFRFPGGTIGNYYHPDGIGYGMKKEETGNTLADLVKAQPLFSQNAIHHFADLCRMANSKVVYVANMLTGNIPEMLWALEYFKKAGIEVVAVELGNEFYYRIYRQSYPTPESYILKAKEYAAAVRKFDPRIKVAAVAADPTEPNPKGEAAIFMKDWNEKVGKESFYDVYVPHLYPKVKACEEKGGDNLETVFDCIDLTLATEYFNYHNIIVDHYRQFYGNKKMWVTEWNVDAASTTANTLRHAAFVAEFLMGMIDINVANNDLVEYAFFHNYGSGGFAAPIFSFTFPGVNYLKSNGKIAYNTTYFPFHYLTSLIYGGAKRAAETVQYPQGTDTRQLVAKTFVNPQKRVAYVFFVNKSATATPLQFNHPQTKAVRMQLLSGKHPWSVAGMNGFYKKLPERVDLVREANVALQDKSVILPAYSVGYVEYTY